MRHFAKAMLRWLYTGVLYLLFAAGLYFWMDTGLASAGISPEGYMVSTWVENCRAMFINTLIGSVALTLLWNALYSWKLLGGRNPGVSVNILNFFFLLAHLAMSAGVFYLTVRYVLSSLLSLGAGFILLHCIPSLFILPFFFATRLLGPQSAAYRFRVLNRLRAGLGLRYY